MVVEVPFVIRRTFEELRNTFPFFIVLRKLNGHYYVYRQISQWDTISKRAKIKQKYLGRITEEGKFLKKVEADTYSTEEAIPTIERTVRLTEVEEKLLTALSMNARTSLVSLGKHVGLTAPAVYNRIKALKKRFGIRYLAEINTDKLGYFKFFIAVKFLEGAPHLAEIKAASNKNPNVQLVVLTKGKYDLMVHVLAKNSLEIMETVIDLRKGLDDYPAEWYVINFYEHFNFVPLRDEFIESLKERLLKRDYAVLKELNTSGDKKFVEIDRKYGFDVGRSSYTFDRLKENGIVTRITLSLENVPTKYIGIIFVSIIDIKKFERNRKKLLLYTIRETTALTMSYVLAGDIGTPDGMVYFVPVFKEGDLETEEEKIKKLDLGVKTDTAVVTNVLTGHFCYRRFDRAYTKQHERLIEDYQVGPFPKISYEETRREKRGSKLGYRGEKDTN